MSSPKLMFIHGLESGPHGSKVRLLRAAGFEVTAEDMHMSIRRLDRRNSMIRQALRLPETQLMAGVVAACFGVSASRRHADAALFGLALGAGWLITRQPTLISQSLACSYEACVEIQRRALLVHQPDVIVGSSWGGAVAIALALRGHWSGPMMLLAPAFGLAARRMGSTRLERDLSELRRKATSQRIVIYHDPADDTVPIQDSEGLVKGSCIELRAVSAGGHRLMGLFEGADFAQHLRVLSEPLVTEASI